MKGLHLGNYKKFVQNSWGRLQLERPRKQDDNINRDLDDIRCKDKRWIGQDRVQRQDVILAVTNKRIVPPIVQGICKSEFPHRREWLLNFYHPHPNIIRKGGKKQSSHVIRINYNYARVNRFLASCLETADINPRCCKQCECVAACASHMHVTSTLLWPANEMLSPYIETSPHQEARHSHCLPCRTSTKQYHMFSLTLQPLHTIRPHSQFLLNTPWYNNRALEVCVARSANILHYSEGQKSSVLMSTLYFRHPEAIHITAHNIYYHGCEWL